MPVAQVPRSALHPAWATGAQVDHNEKFIAQARAFS